MSANIICLLNNKAGLPRNFYI